MMDALLGSAFVQGGAVLILAGVIVSIIRGWLVPQAQVDRMEAFYVKREDDWRAALAASEAARTTLLAQQQRLIEAAVPLTRGLVAQRNAEAVTDATP